MSDNLFKLLKANCDYMVRDHNVFRLYHYAEKRRWQMTCPRALNLSYLHVLNISFPSLWPHSGSHPRVIIYLSCQSPPLEFTRACSRAWSAHTCAHIHPLPSSLPRSLPRAQNTQARAAVVSLRCRVMIRGNRRSGGHKQEKTRGRSTLFFFFFFKSHITTDPCEGEEGGVGVDMRTADRGVTWGWN